MIVERGASQTFSAKLSSVAGSTLGAWRLALALYLPNALLAVFAALPVLVGMQALASVGPWAARAANGDVLTVLVEIAASTQAARVLEGSEPRALTTALGMLALSAFLIVPVLLAQGLAYTIIAGGVLERLVSSRPGTFWSGVWRWIWPMLRFGVLALVVFLVLGGAGVLAIGSIPSRGPSAALLQAAGMVIWLGLVNGLLEVARADMVVRGKRSAIRALGHALALPAHPGAFALAALLWIVLAAAAVLYWGIGGGTALLIPATALAVAFVAQQIVLLVGAWLKVLRLAAAVEVARAMSPGERAE